MLLFEKFLLKFLNRIMFRYDLDLISADDKYEIGLLRARINVANDKIGRQKRVGRLRR